MRVGLGGWGARGARGENFELRWCFGEVWSARRVRAEERETCARKRKVRVSGARESGERAERERQRAREREKASEK